MKDIFRVYVGTYSQPILFGTGEILHGKGTGIHIYQFNTRTGELCESMPPVPAENPSYLAISADGANLYAVNELKTFQGETGGAVSAYQIEAYGGLTLLNQKPTGGADPCYVSLDRDKRCLISANYMSGSVCAYPLEADGRLGERRQIIQHEGRGMDRSRQQGPHAHGAVFTPDERYVVVPDLGIDRLMIYPVDRDERRLSEKGTRSFFVGERMGPRTCAFNQRGDLCFVFCELDPRILTFAYHDGDLTPLEAVLSVTGPCDVENLGADLHLSADDRFLYASNRGQNSIVVFAIQPNKSLQHIQTIDCGGETPRNFTLDPTGGWLLVGNQDSDNIAVFARDKESGTLTLKGKTNVPTPVCVCMDLHSGGKQASSAFDETLEKR